MATVFKESSINFFWWRAATVDFLRCLELRFDWGFVHMNTQQIEGVVTAWLSPIHCVAHRCFQSMPGVYTCSRWTFITFVISHTSRYNNSTRRREVDSTAQEHGLALLQKIITSEIEFHTFQFPIPSRSFIFLFCYCWIIDALFDQLVLINAINVNGDINAPISKKWCCKRISEKTTEPKHEIKPGCVRKIPTAKQENINKHVLTEIS